MTRAPLELKLDLPPDDTFKEVTKARYSSPINLHGVDITALDARDTGVSTLTDLNAILTPLPTSPGSPEFNREKQRSFFSNFRASRSASKLQEEGKVSQLDGANGLRPSTSGGKKNSIYQLRKATGSTPELSLFGNRTGDGINLKFPESSSTGSKLNHNQPPTPPAVSDKDLPAPPLSLDTNTTVPVTNGTKANRKRLPQVLYRSRSTRSDSTNSVVIPKAKAKEVKTTTPKRPSIVHKHSGGSSMDAPISRSVPADSEGGLRYFMGRSTNRNRSADHALLDSDEERSGKPKKSRSKGKKDKEREREAHPLNQSYRNNNTSQLFLNGIRTQGSNAGAGMARVGRAFMNKINRSNSSNERAGADEDYQPRVLKQPLIDQTRLTRIAKSYDHCKDKTEFWMPALPWRCIDFLNGRCEEEGLYRVSGSLTSIRAWRKRFDLELDINLLEEQDLHDSSIIASLFKEWVRELPEEVFPKDRQARVTANLPSELPEANKKVSQALRDELSNLPPFNYYLLFAITCHLSLLLSHQSINKMTLDNLYRCFNQSLKLDGRIFYILVGDWRQCWQGCWTENEYLRAEYTFLDRPYPVSAEYFPQAPTFTGQNEDTDTNLSDERAISSSGSSGPSHADALSTPDAQLPATANPALFAGEAEDAFLDVAALSLGDSRSSYDPSSPPRITTRPNGSTSSAARGS